MLLPYLFHVTTLPMRYWNLSKRLLFICFKIHSKLLRYLWGIETNDQAILLFLGLVCYYVTYEVLKQSSSSSIFLQPSKYASYYVTYEVLNTRYYVTYEVLKQKILLLSYFLPKSYYVTYEVLKQALLSMHFSNVANVTTLPMRYWNLLRFLIFF